MIVLNPLQVAGLDRELAARDGDPAPGDSSPADPTFAPEALIREAQAVRISAEAEEPFGAVADALRDPPVRFFVDNPTNVGRPLTAFGHNEIKAITISSPAITIRPEPLKVAGLPPPETASEELATVIRSIEAQILALRIFLGVFVALAAALMVVWLGWRL